ncbi:uncharacterized protein LAJ45_11770 [Morchella importuna]|uniref:uncharacterized protein n=1 Tax=Morchella importuna TaxID=1174673 RepID=UPI001E8D1596|nr:uncharacterized protein LAJ45_11770 [Morchella importuna]KAH8144257.1 hypothetical protein LAJ45_11770 [Morchella importuna]
MIQKHRPIAASRNSNQYQIYISKLAYYPGRSPYVLAGILRHERPARPHRQTTTFAPGSAAGPSHSLGPPGDMAHVRRALANALVAWAAMRFPPPPETLGWSDSAHST